MHYAKEIQSKKGIECNGIILTVCSIKGQLKPKAV